VDEVKPNYRDQKNGEEKRRLGWGGKSLDKKKGTPEKRLADARGT